MPSKLTRHGLTILVALLFMQVTPAQQYPPAQNPAQNAPPQYQNGPPPGAQNGPPPGTPLSAPQMDDLVAPIALYPDPLLGEILAASTYPIEIAEAQQWVVDHPKWKPSKMMDEAKKQNW